MRTGDSLLCKGIWCLDKPLLFKGFWLSVQSPPAKEVWFRCAPPHVASLINSVQDRRDVPLMNTYANRGLPALQRYWSLDKPLLFNDFWLSVQSPPATEVWFRCAPPHVASLINSVQDRRDLPLMSEGAAAASSCEAGPLSPGVKFQK